MNEKKKEMVTLEKYNKLLGDYNEMKSKYDAIEASGMEMGFEIEGLRRSVSSYKGGNTRLKKECERLSMLLKESDELYDKKASEVGDLRLVVCGKDSCIEEKTKLIDGLHSQIAELRETISQYESLVKDLRGDISAYEANAEWFNALPWWRKMFAKI